MWCAVPEEAIFYHLTRRHAIVTALADTADEKRYRLNLDGLSDRVTCRALTLDADVAAAWCRYPRVRVNNQPMSASVVRPGVLRVTVEVEDGMELTYSA